MEKASSSRWPKRCLAKPVSPRVGRLHAVRQTASAAQTQGAQAGHSHHRTIAPRCRPLRAQRRHVLTVGRVDLRRRKLALVRASDCGLRGGRSCEHHQRERWDVHRSMQAEISLNTETLTLRQKFRLCAMLCGERTRAREVQSGWSPSLPLSDCGRGARFRMWSRRRGNRGR
jgi:hypothetical protein